MRAASPIMWLTKRLPPNVSKALFLPENRRDYPPVSKSVRVVLRTEATLLWLPRGRKARKFLKHMANIRRLGRTLERHLG